MNRWVALVLASTLFGAAGCSTYVKRGSALYADGRYVEAAEVFEHTERRLADSSPRQRAEYGTYRGLTLLALGDPRQAQRWLGYAYDVERQWPGALRADRRADLDRGWAQLNAARPLPPGTAVAASQPPPPVVPQPAGAPGATQRSLVP